MARHGGSRLRVRRTTERPCMAPTHAAAGVPGAGQHGKHAADGGSMHRLAPLPLRMPTAASWLPTLRGTWPGSRRKVYRWNSCTRERPASIRPNRQPMHLCAEGTVGAGVAPGG